MLYVARGAALLISNGSTYPRLRGGAPARQHRLPAHRRCRLARRPDRDLDHGRLRARSPSSSCARRRSAAGCTRPAATSAQPNSPVSRVKVIKLRRLHDQWLLRRDRRAHHLVRARPARTPTLGETFELNAIAAVVIGGAALSGGRGNVRGVLLGAFVIGFLADGLVLVEVSTFWQIVDQGRRDRPRCDARPGPTADQAIKNAALAAASSPQRVCRCRHGPPSRHDRDAATGNQSKGTKMNRK